VTGDTKAYPPEYSAAFRLLTNAAVPMQSATTAINPSRCISRMTVVGRGQHDVSSLCAGTPARLASRAACSRLLGCNSLMCCALSTGWQDKKSCNKHSHPCRQLLCCDALAVQLVYTSSVCTSCVSSASSSLRYIRSVQQGKDGHSQSNRGKLEFDDRKLGTGQAQQGKNLFCIACWVILCLLR
jgi:hypothetical protein